MEWNNDNTLQLGSSLAYYAIFSISPLLIIVIEVIGLFYNGNSSGYIRSEIAVLIGDNAATALAGTINSVQASEHGRTATVISVVLLLIGASGVFVQLQNAMNQIWGVMPKPGHFMKDFLKQRLVSFAMILGFSFLLLISLLISAALAAITGYFQFLLPGTNSFWHILDALVSFLVVTLVFASIYKVMPDVRIDWNDVWVGAFVTAVLFTAGKSLIAFYLGRSGIGSAFGAAGSVLVFLAWVYYSSQILFLGAEFTKAYSEERGLCVRPARGAKAVTEDARERAFGTGLSPKRNRTASRPAV
jgi:membrane protein